MKKSLLVLSLAVATGLFTTSAFADNSSAQKSHSAPHASVNCDHNHGNASHSKHDHKNDTNHDHKHDHKGGNDAHKDEGKEANKIKGCYQDKKAPNPADVKGTFEYGYTAIYSLKAGETYTIVVGHTHEEALHLGMVKSEPGLDARVAGNKLFKSKEVDVENFATFKLEPGKLYHLDLGHRASEYNFTVPADGKYILFADSPASKYLPYELQNSKEDLVLPSYQHTISNVKAEIYNGYFADDMVKDRGLSDYAGNWQSIYPYLLDGTLDPVWAEKAKHSTTMDAKAYKEYYTTGYKTDVKYILIEGNKITFTKDNGEKSVGTYAYDGKTILNYSKGNRGVRFQFVNTDPNSTAPKYVQFSDHNIYPVKAGHFHIFWGNSSQAEINKELVNWPTYYPASYNKKEILDEMLHH